MFILFVAQEYVRLDSWRRLNGIEITAIPKSPLWLTTYAHKLTLSDRLPTPHIKSLSYLAIDVCPPATPKILNGILLFLFRPPKGNCEIAKHRFVNGACAVSFARSLFRIFQPSLGEVLSWERCADRTQTSCCRSSNLYLYISRYLWTHVDTDCRPCGERSWMIQRLRNDPRQY